MPEAKSIVINQLLNQSTNQMQIDISDRLNRFNRIYFKSIKLIRLNRLLKSRKMASLLAFSLPPAVARL